MRGGLEGYIVVRVAIAVVCVGICLHVAKTAIAQQAEPPTDANPAPPITASGPQIPPNALLIGITPYEAPKECDNATPESSIFKEAMAGKELEPLSTVRRGLLDCISEIDATIALLQRDLPAADLKLEQARNRRLQFTQRLSPEEELARSKSRLIETIAAIKDIEGTAKPLAPVGTPPDMAASPPALTEDQIGRLRYLKDDERYYNQRIPELEAAVEPYNKEAQEVADDVASAETLKFGLEKNLRGAQRHGQTARGLLDRIDDRINQLLSVDQMEGRYKLWLSAAFAGLIGVVIVGFFLLAKADKRVRRQIFAGDAGLQFVTLFALVIAIILFGIIGILEGRELSALLGGISGYILGRSSNKLAGQNGNTPPANAEGGATGGGPIAGGAAEGRQGAAVAGE
jgi:hypothetical protein